MTKRAYIGNTSTNKIDDQNNVAMSGSAVTNRLMDFERKSQSFISRYRGLVDKAIGGQRRTTLNTTADDALKESWVRKSQFIPDMIACTNLNLDVQRDANCLTSPSQTRRRRTKKQREGDETPRIATDIPSDFLVSLKIIGGQQIWSCDTGRVYLSHK